MIKRTDSVRGGVNEVRNRLLKAAAVIVALLIWQIAAFLINQLILLVSPVEVAAELLYQVVRADFWLTVWFSLRRIFLGFFIALAAGVLLAALSYRFNVFKVMIRPYISVVKSAPVASIIILILIFLSSRNLSVFVSFLIVLPVVYANTLEGLVHSDKKLVEMADVFHAGMFKRIRFIYVPQLRPYLISACTAAIGMSWKAGTAAEVIGIPKGSIGERLYEAKIYLSSRELFAWTAVIIALSLIVEKIVILLIRKAYGALVSSNPGSGDTAKGPGIRTGRSIGRAMAVCVIDLKMSFGANIVMNDTNMVFAEGKRTVLMGESGCGKTTLLRILMGVETPDSGEIRGVPEYVSAVFQENRLFEEFSAVSNIAFAAEKGIKKEAIIEHLEEVGLRESAYQRVSEMSGGMKRRVAIVRAVLAKKGLLLLDEPLKGLDDLNRERVAAYIRRHSEGITSIIVTHDADDVRLMDADLIRMGENEK